MPFRNKVESFFLQQVNVGKSVIFFCKSIFLQHCCRSQKWWNLGFDDAERFNAIATEGTFVDIFLQKDATIGQLEKVLTIHESKQHCLKVAKKMTVFSTLLN